MLPVRTPAMVGEIHNYVGEINLFANITVVIRDDRFIMAGMESDKDILLLESSATEWRDAWPAGNGTAGALVFGDIQNETVILNHESCWLYGKTQELPNVSDSLKAVRALMADRNYQEAHDYYRDRLKTEGYAPQMSSYSPVATLEIRQLGQDDVADYQRCLNMGSGEVTVAWRQQGVSYSRKLFASREDGRIYYLLESSTEDGLNIELRLEPLDGNTDDSWIVSNSLDFSTSVDTNRLILREREGSNRPFGTVIHVVIDGGESLVEDGSIRITAAKTILLEIVVLAEADETDFDIVPTGTGYYQALIDHKSLHSSLYNRVKLNLQGTGAETVQTMFDYGRYLMIASSGGKLPPNLQGIWNGDILPIWNCFFMLNENIQMMHWQSLPGNYTESLLPMFDFYESRMDDFRENARKLFACRGIFIPANIVPDTGLLTDLQGHLIHWITGAAWLARFYYDYYLYTGDESFLKERALPLMKETALFFEDYLYENQKGELEFCPSVSPENAPEEFNRELRMDAKCNVTINATMDVALCKELLTNLLSTLQVCAVDDPKIGLWERMIQKLPKYGVNEDGAIREWLHDDFSDNYHHRHQSHIYPFFPGSEIKMGDNLIPAIERAVEKRLSVGLKEQTGWSVVHLANIYARLGLGDRALECLEILKDYCTGENLFTYHNDWRERGVCEAKPKHFDKRVFQIDANLGYPAAIMEMLCYSTTDCISFLPGLPSDFAEGEISGIKCRGNIDLTLGWSPGKIVFTLESPENRTLKINFPSELKTLILNGENYAGSLTDVRVELKAGKPLCGKAAR